MKRLTFKMMSALLAVLFAVSACSSNAATPTQTSNANPPAAPAATSVPTHAAPAATTAPTAAATDTPAAQSQVTIVATGVASTIDPCALVTKDEASQAIGGQLQAGTENSTLYTGLAQGLALGSATVATCSYVGTTPGQYVLVAVYQFTGLAQAAVVQEFKTKMAQTGKATEISGLGDDAYGMPAIVIALKGNVAIAVAVVSSPQDLALGKYDKSQALVTTALTRLP